ncbi:hypothetical protein ACFQX6_27135 [Streptosporangium lutulentum]
MIRFPISPGTSTPVAVPVLRLVVTDTASCPCFMRPSISSEATTSRSRTSTRSLICSLIRTSAVSPTPTLSTAPSPDTSWGNSGHSIFSSSAGVNR